jgi:choline dehydrogenase
MFDYIIIGAGSAGCVMANRLSKNPSHQVLLLEAGEKDSNPIIQIPAGVAMLFAHEKLNWRYWTEPEPGLKNRKIYWPRGKVLGGCSSIHGMVHMRGHAEDYNDWQKLGAEGWGWDDVFPYFKQTESYQDDSKDKEEGYRGTDGEMIVRDVRSLTTIVGDFVEAAVATGIPRNSDFNGFTHEGTGLGQVNVTKNSRRVSCAKAFLHPVKDRSNLTIETRAFAKRILFEGRRACGVEYEKADGKTAQAQCAKEVILCGGSVNSPQLLQLSGIGAADHLTPLGIDMVHNLPGVGENLQDHLYVPLKCRATKGVRTLNGQLLPWKYPLHMIRWFFTGGGPMTMNTSDAYAFVASSPEEKRPDLQISIRSCCFSYDEERNPYIDDYEGFSFNIFHVRPRSVGSIKITSPDAKVYPSIRANYLSDDDGYDAKALLSGIIWTRKILANNPIASRVESEESPGEKMTDEAELLDYIRGSVEPVYHPVGTCKMGKDELSVVDPRLRVHGVDGLRVVDASVMPTVTAGNTNIPTVMIAAKGAEMILDDNH